MHACMQLSLDAIFDVRGRSANAATASSLRSHRVPRRIFGSRCEYLSSVPLAYRVFCMRCLAALGSRRSCGARCPRIHSGAGPNARWLNISLAETSPRALRDVVAGVCRSRSAWIRRAKLEGSSPGVVCRSFFALARLSLRGGAPIEERERTTEPAMRDLWRRATPSAERVRERSNDTANHTQSDRTSGSALAISVAMTMAGCATPSPTVTMDPRPSPPMPSISEQAGTSTLAVRTTPAPTVPAAPSVAVSAPNPTPTDPTAGRVRLIDPEAPYVRVGDPRSRVGPRWIDRRTGQRVAYDDPEFARWMSRQAATAGRK